MERLCIGFGHCDHSRVQPNGLSYRSGLGSVARQGGGILMAHITSTNDIAPGRRLPPFTDGTYIKDTVSNTLTFDDLLEFIMIGEPDDRLTRRERDILRQLRG